jgi:hypothetical protein
MGSEIQRDERGDTCTPCGRCLHNGELFGELIQKLLQAGSGVEVQAGSNESPHGKQAGALDE